jgi:hypothetical protein
MKTEQILIKIEADLKKKSKIYAKKNYKSLSELIRTLLIDVVNNKK